MQRVRKGDQVVIVAGKDKGQRGSVLRVLGESDRVVVEGINVVTKHIKPTRRNQRGGLEKREAPIHLSNVMLADPTTGEPTRIRFKVLESGDKVRVSVKTGEQLDK
ncbi:MAG: 50S ribosomal protein L24 [Myxococcales bacterium FL481]|nr:MAG: 50S ribosomal protein L24 [Myxococcales bacterium FL481]